MSCNSEWIHAVLQVVYQLTDSFNLNNFRWFIFVDLSKALDVVDHYF